MEAKENIIVSLNVWAVSSYIFNSWATLFLSSGWFLEITSRPWLGFILSNQGPMLITTHKGLDEAFNQNTK